LRLFAVVGCKITVVGGRGFTAPDFLFALVLGPESA